MTTQTIQRWDAVNHYEQPEVFVGQIATIHGPMIWRTPTEVLSFTAKTVTVRFKATKKIFRLLKDNGYWHGNDSLYLGVHESTNADALRSM